MPAMNPMGDLNVVYKGGGNAVIDPKAGIFTEVETTLQYATPKPTGGAFSTRMQGALKTRWEMERR